jgi:hypothetical protein
MTNHGIRPQERVQCHRVNKESSARVIAALGLLLAKARQVSRASELTARKPRARARKIAFATVHPKHGL